MAWAVDYARLLKANDFAVEKIKDGSKEISKLFPGGHSEKYFMRDREGRTYKLRLTHPLLLQSEIASSLLIESMGLPNPPIYPLVVKRGQNNIPSSEEAKRIAMKDREGEMKSFFAGGFGISKDYFLASAQPVVPIVSYSKENINGQQAADFLGHVIAHYLVANKHLSYKKGASDFDIQFTGKKFVTLDITPDFSDFILEEDFRKFIGKQNALEIGSALKLDPIFLKLYAPNFHFDINGFAQKDRRQFLKGINVYLSRLEALSQTQLNSFFSKVFSTYESDFGSNKISKEFSYRIQNIRKNVLFFLQPSLSHSEREMLSRPVKVSKIHVQIPNANKNRPVDLLWKFFFHYTQKTREKIFQSDKEFKKLRVELKSQGQKNPDLIEYLKHKIPKTTPKKSFEDSQEKSSKKIQEQNHCQRLLL